jgi:hypothetical protein
MLPPNSTPNSSSTPPQLLLNSSSTPSQLLLSSSSAPPQLLLNSSSTRPQLLLNSSTLVKSTPVGVTRIQLMFKPSQAGRNFREFWKFRKFCS